MDSFHHSRARTLFEVLCAFGMAASCAAAWMQLGATALLAAAGISALYGLVHAFDMARSRPAAAQLTETPVNNEPAAIELPIESKPAEAPPPAPAKPARTKAKAKKSGKQAKSPAVEAAPVPHDDRPIEQLFEPQPFIRQQRPAFGRRDRRPPPFAPTV
jgi:hypothetical protein